MQVSMDQRRPSMTALVIYRPCMRVQVMTPSALFVSKVSVVALLRKMLRSLSIARGQWLLRVRKDFDRQRARAGRRLGADLSRDRLRT